MEFKGCKITIENKIKSISKNQAIKFALKFISYYLAEEILPYNGSVWIPHEVDKKQPLAIKMDQVKKTLRLQINGCVLLQMNSTFFHNSQMIGEAYGDIHCSFFKEMHLSKVSGYGYLQGRR